MKGIYVVETIFDYCTQLVAFATREEAEKSAQKWTKKLDKQCWVAFYRFGQNFDCD